MQQTISSATRGVRLDVTALREQLRRALAAWLELSDPQWTVLASLFSVRFVGRHYYVVLPGTRRHELFFVCSGLVRLYTLAEDGAEANQAFVAEGELGGALSAFTSQCPIPYGGQALEPTTLLAVPYRAFVALFDEHPAFERLGRKVAQALLTRNERYLRRMEQPDAGERYRDFVAEAPHLIDRVPDYHLAAYLGMSDAALARLRRETRS